MLNALPRKNDRVFATTSYRSFERNFHYVRKRTAAKLQNPRLFHIHFHTLRHWKATMKYHKTKDILHVMKLLGHRNIQNTLLYTQLVKFESDEFHSAVAKTVDEAKALIEEGFEYVCTHESIICSEKGSSQSKFPHNAETFYNKFIWWIGGLGCSTSYMMRKDIRRPGFSESDDTCPARLEEPPSLKANKLYQKSVHNPYLKWKFTEV